MKASVIAASVLSADFGRLAEEVRAVDAAGADWIHIDIMDGRVVPNISFDPVVMKAIRGVTAKPVHVHLMIVEPKRYLEDFVEAGAGHRLIHVEPVSTSQLYRTLERIRGLGRKAGIVIDPATPVSMVEHVLSLVEIVLVMAVNPGFGGQSFIPAMTPKLAAVRKMCVARGLALWIAVDGGMRPETIGRASADAFVAGSAIFGSSHCGDAIATLRTEARAA